MLLRITSHFAAMHSNVFLFVSMIVRAASSFQYGELDLPGLCPTVRYIEDLDFTRVHGFWYRCFSTWDSPLCYNNDGQTVYAYPFNSTVSGVAACCRSAADPEHVTCSAEVGTGFVRPLSRAGLFSYEFDGQSFRNVVLAVDYESFLFTYSCKATFSEQIFIYTRTYEQCESIERRARNVLSQNGIPWSHVKRVKHGPSIPYTTVPKPC